MGIGGSRTGHVADSSGYTNDGVVTGTLATQSDDARYNFSTYFNGSSYITAPNP